MAKKEVKQVVDFPFGKENYRLMFVGIGLVLIGFICMIGGGSEDPAVWDPSIFSTMRITVAPVLVITGLFVEVFAITKKARD